MAMNKKNEDNNVELLNYVYQNAKMGSQSISQIIPKVSNQHMQQALLDQLSQYQDIVNQASDMLIDLNATPKESVVDKFSSKAGIALNTIADTSASHIAEMMINGSTMGIIDITRKINESKGCSQDVCDLCDNLLQIEENGAHCMKQFL